MSTITDNGMQAQPSLGKSLLVAGLVIAAVLTIPLVAMQFTSEINWDGTDFLAAAGLMALAGLALILTLRRLRSARSRLIAAGLIGIGFLYCWAEMAVGILTNIGS